MILQATNIHKTYSTGKDSSLNVLKGISLSIVESEIIAIVGPSGAGKSTLVHILGLLDKPTQGEVSFEGKNITSLKDEEISTLRNQKIGFVFQFHHLLPEFTALENVLMPTLIAGKSIKSETERAKNLLSEVGLSERIDHKPSELSGGEQQRVAVARALMNNPKIIFADEPSGNLDSENADKLHNLIFDLRSKFGQSFVIVTHNKELAARADRIVTMVDGKII
ncbi:MAG: ABC transporter ATP-binding protein [Ignavibacteriales bacterium]|nr:ABC transporter ATP-binding protein [Ignavibacteriales bacterium]